MIPGIRESFYGLFWVNLGVLLPCVYEVERGIPATEFIQEYNCTIRARLGKLAFDEDKCFELAGDTTALATTIVGLLDRFGVDFLEQFQDYNSVLNHYNLHGVLPFQNSSRATLEAALIAHHIGNETMAKTLFVKAHASDNKGFQAHVVKIASRVGIKID